VPDLTYRSPKTEARPSPIHGMGLFAKQAFSASDSNRDAYTEGKARYVDDIVRKAGQP